MSPLNAEDVDVLVELVVKASAETLIDAVLIESGSTDEMIHLKQLEMKLLVMKGEMQDAR